MISCWVVLIMLWKATLTLNLFGWNPIVWPSYRRSSVFFRRGWQGKDVPPPLLRKTEKVWRQIRWPSIFKRELQSSRFWKFFKSKTLDCSLLTKTLIIEIRPYHRLSFKQKLVTRKLSTKDAVKGLPLPCMRGQLVSISSSYLFYSRQGRDSRGRSQGFANDSFK